MKILRLYQESMLLLHKCPLCRKLSRIFQCEMKLEEGSTLHLHHTNSISITIQACRHMTPGYLTLSSDWTCRVPFVSKTTWVEASSCTKNQFEWEKRPCRRQIWRVVSCLQKQSISIQLDIIGMITFHATKESAWAKGEGATFYKSWGLKVFEQVKWRERGVTMYHMTHERTFMIRHSRFRKALDLKVLRSHAKPFVKRCQIWSRSLLSFWGHREALLRSRARTKGFQQVEEQFFWCWAHYMCST